MPLHCENCGDHTEKFFSDRKNWCRKCVMEDTTTKFRAKQQNRKPKTKVAVTAEENWNGVCKGGCGKYNSGEYVCGECRTAKAEKSLALKPGEMELYRGHLG